MQDPAEVVKITCARFCISYPGLAPIGIGGLNTIDDFQDSQLNCDFLINKEEQKKSGL